MIAQLLGISEIIEKELRKYPEFFLKRLKVSGFIIRDEFDLLRVEGLYWQHQKQIEIQLQQIYQWKRLYEIIESKYGSAFFLSESPIVNMLYDMLNDLSFPTEFMHSSLSTFQLKTELSKRLSLVPFYEAKPARKNDYKRFKKKSMPKILFKDFSLSSANFGQFLQVSQMLREAQREIRDGNAGEEKAAYVEKLEQRYDELVQKFDTENHVVVAPSEKNGV